MYYFARRSNNFYLIEGTQGEAIIIYKYLARKLNK